MIIFALRIDHNHDKALAMLITKTTMIIFALRIDHNHDKALAMLII